ncbi:SGNH/GDSL hydrolase family protein [Pantoea vagans]|uniref:SGNH/GDSL hydrolase family protein n=1 Tax=Pantoea vagans TaxID=470934 RepID=UPI003FA3AFAA
MPTSDYCNIICKLVKASIIVMLSATGLVWLNQQSLSQYWTLHFHRESPWSSYSSPLWIQGAAVMRAAEAAKKTFATQLLAPESMPEPKVKELIAPEPAPIVLAKTALLPESPANERQLSRWLTTKGQARPVSLESDPDSPVADPLYNAKGEAILPAGRKVLLIGDSMMEGVAPRVIKLLRDRYQSDGINLSQRSTGLAYPGFFNWPKTTAQALAAHADIGLLAVFLGPNDPWDMPAGKGEPYLKFGSEEWKIEYSSRIRQILELGLQYHIPVIWILPPNMKREKLNRSMAELDILYRDEVRSIGGIVLDINALFGYQGNIYSAFATINGKRVNVRASDGIHYSLTGQQLIAEAIIEEIEFETQSSEKRDVE